MDDVVVLFIAMIVIGAAVFGPLGYFMYKFSGYNPEPFWKPIHGDEHHPSMVNSFAEYAIVLVKKQLNKSKALS